MRTVMPYIRRLLEAPTERTLRRRTTAVLERHYNIQPRARWYHWIGALVPLKLAGLCGKR